ncbi:DUF3060 domain-containing protein [Leifsonia sp. 2TAF2]|uniref:DUF3060 domain-containing protein n=1 Tax=Leifsonia sp. 2TAF2 TaxID=3233009 RepID=UPI003F95BBB8
MHSRTPLRALGTLVVALSATAAISGCASAANAAGETVVARGHAEVVAPGGASIVTAGATVIAERKTRTSIRANTAKLTIHCEDDTAAVVIEGRFGDVTVDSDCGTTVVRGAHNFVTLQNVRGLQVAGTANFVDYLGTGTTTPKIGGVDNTIAQR